MSGCIIDLKEDASAELFTQLEKEQVDLLVDIPSFDNIMDYENVTLGEERILVAVPKSMKLNVQPNTPYPKVAFAELEDQPFIILSKTRTLGRYTWNEFLRAGFYPNIRLQCHNTEMAHMMANRGMGIALVPEFTTCHHRLDNLNYYILADVPLAKEINVIYKKGRTLTDDERIFVDMLKHCLNRK